MPPPKNGAILFASRKKRRQAERQELKKRKNSSGKNIDSTLSSIDAGPDLLRCKRKGSDRTEDQISFEAKGAKKKSMLKVTPLEALSARGGNSLFAPESMDPSNFEGSSSADPLVAREDAEIAYLERKLGVRGSSAGKSKLAREFEDDGLGGDFLTFLDSLDTVGRSDGETGKLDSNRLSDDEDEDEDGVDEAEWDQAEYEKNLDAAYAHLPTDDEDDADDEEVEQSDVEDDDGAGEEGVRAVKRVRFGEVDNTQHTSDHEYAGNGSKDSKDEEEEEEEDDNDSDLRSQDDDTDVNDEEYNEGHDKDGYASVSFGPVDPFVAREDAEIAYLEKKLGGGKQKKQSTTLYDEMEANEFGEGFGSFLKDLDVLGEQIRSDRQRQPPPRHKGSKSSRQETRPGLDGVANYGDGDDCDDDSDISHSEEGGSDHVTHGTGLGGVGGRKEGDSEEDKDIQSSSSKRTDTDDSSVPKDNYQPTAGEDIYGRSTADSGTGMATALKYVPPALRGKQQQRAVAVTAERTEQLSRLNRKVTGCLNRLAESSLEAVTKEILPLFLHAAADTNKKKKKGNEKTETPRYAAADVAEAVTSGLLKACVSETQILKGIVPSAAALVCALHSLLKETGGGRGGELFGALFVEKVAADLQVASAEDKKWSSAAMTADDGLRPLGSEGDGLLELGSKRCANLVLLVAALYGLGLIQCHLVLGLAKQLLAPKTAGKKGESQLRSIDLEMLLLLLRESGPRLRADDPTAIREITATVKELGVGSEENSRLLFMKAELERLNKQGKKKQHSSKSAQLMDQDSLTRMRKLVQRLCKASATSSSSSGGGGGGGLHMSWDDLVNAEERGRWWRTGASWVQQTPTAGDEASLSSVASQSGGGDGDDGSATTKSLLARSREGEGMAAAAARQRMNTDARRSAFGAIMGADSVNDALQRLAHAHKCFRGSQGREVCRVLVECCGAEAGSYNPYYAALAKCLCASGEGDHRFTLQLCYWDLFKNLSEVPARRAANLACMLAFLVAGDCLSLANTLKPVDVVELSASSPVALLFFKKFILTLMLTTQDDSAQVQGARTPPSERDPLKVACSALGASKETLLIRDQVAVFLSQHIKAPPALDGDEIVMFETRRKHFKRCLRDAKVLRDSAVSAKQRYRALKNQGKNNKGNNSDPTDIDGSRPDDEWAMFYGK